MTTNRHPPHGFPLDSPIWSEWQEQIRKADLSTFTGILPVANGGTGAATAAAGRGNLGAYGAGDTPTFADVLVADEVYDATNWNGDLTVPTKNSVRDKIESVIAGSSTPSDVAYDATSWDGDLEAPTKNVVRDKFESLVIPVASDVAYDEATWNADLDVPTKNAVRDKFESLVIPVASDVAYDESTWNANTDVPTKNAVRDKFESMPTLDSGTYTPTLTDTTNIDDSNAFQAQYLRVGSTVTVSGKVEIDTTSTGQTILEIEIPIASNFGAQEDLAGTHSNAAGLSGIVFASTADDRAILEFVETAAGVETYYFHFTYQVI